MDDHEPPNEQCIEWVVRFTDSKAIEELWWDLEISKTTATPRGISRSGAVPFSPYLVAQTGQLRIEIFSNEHPPPHFRVKCGSESADYHIKDCQQRDGRLKRHHRAIKAWHAKNKPLLITTWNERRPTDCPVGLYREE